MKKFMKAIAFVTVMCLALSTVAFANSVPEVADADKTFVVTVTEAGANEQVALMVVEEGKDFSDPLYINQQGANENGDTTFEAVLTNAAVESVDVYVGYAANGTNPAIKVGTVKLEQPITEVTVTKVNAEIVSAEGDQQVGAGVAIKLDVEAPKGVSATEMIWAIKYMDGGVEKAKYYGPIDVTGYGIGTTLTTGFQLGLAFLNGFNREGEEIASIEITDVDVIFMFKGADNFSQEVLTDSNDKLNEVPKAN